MLGDKLLDDKFQNSVIDALVERCSTPDAQDDFQHNPGGSANNHAYSSTTESATIHKLFMPVYVDIAEPNWLSEELPKEFLHSVIEGLLEKIATFSESAINRSEDYMHPSRD